MHFWSNVQAEMARRGLTAKALAGQIGVTPAALSTYARGTVPSLEVAARVSQVLEVSLDSLVFGQEGERVPVRCPAPEEHRLLHELLHELGISEVMTLSSLGTQSASWRITEILIEQFPAPVPLDALRQRLPDIPLETFQASLTMLRRKGLAQDRKVDGLEALALQKLLSDFSARDLGNLSLHVLRTVRVLFERILPALEREDESGRLLTFNGRIPRARAKALIAQVMDSVKRQVSEVVDLEEGDTDIFLSVGVACGPE